MKEKVKIGTILVHSIGFGCDEFYQVIKRTPKTVRAKKLNTKLINLRVKYQTCDEVPIPNSFYKNGFGKNEELILKIADDGQIGPVKRLIWWNVWDGKPREQWSN